MHHAMLNSDSKSLTVYEKTLSLAFIIKQEAKFDAKMRSAIYILFSNVVMHKMPLVNK